STTAARKPRLSFRHLWLEQLEDRTLPSTFKWVGGAADANWTTAGNWNVVSGAGAFPNAAGDVAQFTGSYSSAQTAVVNQAITVGRIDFATASNITISSSGTNV